MDTKEVSGYALPFKSTLEVSGYALLKAAERTTGDPCLCLCGHDDEEHDWWECRGWEPDR